MKRITFLLLLICTGIMSYANLLQEKCIREYRFSPVYFDFPVEANSIASSLYQELTLLQFIDGTEEINGKTYHYVWGASTSVYRDDFNCNMDYYDYPAGPGLWINAVNLNLYPDQIGTYSPVWKKIFLIRQESDKVYLYVDRNYRFTERITSQGPGEHLAVDWEKFDAGSEDELLLYDFGLNEGDVSSTVMCDPGDGTPSVINYEVAKRSDTKDSDEIIIEGFYKPAGDSEPRLIKFSNQRGMLGSASLCGVYDRNETYCLENRHFDQRDFPSIPDRLRPEEPVSTGIRQNLFYYRPGTGNMPEQFYMVERDAFAPETGSLYRYKYYERDASGNYVEYDGLKDEIARFRKENGKIWVRCREEWKDSETMSHFGKDEELLYIDLNLKKGDILNTFSVNDGIVTKHQKKVFGLTTTTNLFDNPSQVMVFYDDNGVPDTTGCYIDGIGFITVDIPDNNADGPTTFLKAVKDGETGQIAELQQYKTFGGHLAKEGIEEAVINIPNLSGVYNLQGIKVGETIGNLPAGLYIVNGKKVLIK